MKIDERHNKKLLVEGNDDQHVIWALCQKYEIPETFDVIDCEGIDKLEKRLSVQFKGSDIDAVGIIIDADIDLEIRWNKVKAILSKNGFDVPVGLPHTGAICKNTDEDKTVGVWIMPDNNTAGMLEDFIKFLIPEDDNLSPVIETHLNEIEEQDLNRYKPIHKSKAFMCSWLALQEEPGIPMGRSITRNFLTTEPEVCGSLVEWLKELFE